MFFFCGGGCCLKEKVFTCNMSHVWLQSGNMWFPSMVHITLKIVACYHPSIPGGTIAQRRGTSPTEASFVAAGCEPTT